MQGVRPTQFPILPSLSGTEELYTQLQGGGNYKFTVLQLKNYISTQITDAQIVQTISTPVEVMNVSGSGNHEHIMDFYCPTPMELHPDADTVEMMIVLYTYIEFQGQEIDIKLSNPLAGASHPIVYQAQQDGMYEVVKSAWLPVQYPGTISTIAAQNNTVNSQSDAMDIKQGAMILFRATKS
jgi:hypothetical protein